MIQRVQTLYLFIAAIALAILFVVPIYTFQRVSTDGQLTEAKITLQGNFEKPVNSVDYIQTSTASTRILLSAGISLLLLLCIFQYSNRKRQVALARILIIAEFALVVVMLSSFQAQINAPDLKNVQMNVGVALPSLAIIFTALAARAIRKDEEMVKSADRLR